MEKELITNDSAEESSNNRRDKEYDGVSTERLSVTEHRTSQETEPIGISWLKAGFLIMNAALGAGLLNFPAAFMESGGIFTGNIVHLIFVSFAFGSLMILATLASMKQCCTYQEVVLNYCGMRWGLFCSILISIYCFITCVTFIIIIGDQFDRVFASFVNVNFCHFWYMNRKFTMSITSIFLIWPCSFKRMDGFQLMSYVGVATIWYLTCIIAIELVYGDYPSGDVEIWDVHPLKMVLVIPTVCFGYQCHVSSVPIYSCLRDRDNITFMKACAAAIALCIIVYTISANCGYTTFGSLVGPDILVSYDATKPQIFIAILLLTVKSWTTYPILLFCVREAMNDIYIHFLGATRFFIISENLRRKVLATSLCVGTIIFAVFIPSIEVAVKLLGSLAAFFIFVFPGLCLFTMTFNSAEFDNSEKGRKKWCQIIIAVLYLSLGAFTFGLSFVLGLNDIFHPKLDDGPICR